MSKLASFLTFWADSAEQLGNNEIAGDQSMWLPVMWPGCPPAVKSPDWALACPPPGEARRFVAGGGPLGFIYRDAITCLSFGIVGLGRGLVWGRRAALRGVHGLHWSAPEGGPVRRRTDQSTGPHEGASGDWWRRWPTDRG